MFGGYILSQIIQKHSLQHLKTSPKYWMSETRSNCQLKYFHSSPLFCLFCRIATAKLLSTITGVWFSSSSSCFSNLLHCKISFKLSSLSFPSRIFTIPVSKCLFFTIRAFFPRYFFSGSSFGNFLAVSSISNQAVDIS